MSHAGRHAVRVGSLILLLALALSVIAGCSSSSMRASVTPTLNVPKDPAPVTVVAGQATTLDLGGGADLIIPPGAMPAGATVRATYQGRPGGNWTDIAPTFAPVELISNPPNVIHGLLTLEFPVDPSKITPDVDPAVQFGISTYDSHTNTWTPVDSTYDPARHKVVALIPHFSWWNPFTWDFGALFARTVQDFGELVGARAGPPTCTGSPPAWVASLLGTSENADVAVRSCGQSQGNILDIEMVNNRPYGQVLTYGSSVKWGWHQDGESLSDIARNYLMDHKMSPHELYLPPLGRASVGIFEPSAGATAGFQIWPTPLSIAADLFFYLVGKGIDKLPLDGHCLSLDTQASLKSVSPGALRDDLVGFAKCIEQGFKDLIKSGALDKVAVSKFTTLFGVIEDASVVGNGIALAGGFVWKIGDLVADWAGNHDSALGNGFSVSANPAPPPPTVTPTLTAPPTVTPTSTPVPQSHPVDAYSNYGPTTDGRAMCRGNPYNSASMPGGTVSQTFTVPGGVASLNSAKVQIDPDSTVTAHLTIIVNGNVAATATAAAVGDTWFTFGPVRVTPGDAITVTISFTATYGKIITVYAVGNPGGTFAASNTCSAGAPSFSTTSTGLRAVVSGMS